MAKKRNGFSAQYYTKQEILEYTVYYERKDKVIFCTIEDNSFEKSFRGKAVCHTMDEFDEIRGREIAFTKAYIKYLEFLEKVEKKVEREFSNIFDSADRLKTKNRKLLERGIL